MIMEIDFIEERYELIKLSNCLFNKAINQN